MTLLSVRNLTTTFDSPGGTVRAVDGVSFTVAEGETLGLVGESGCGKSVTALSLLKLIPTPPGRIGAESVVEFGGRNLVALDDRELRTVRGAEIGMIFQEPTSSLNPVLTVGYQIAETIQAHERVSRKDARERAVELLKVVGIPEPASRAGSYPHELSGGMQQRVMIAIALSCNPRLLIADEPTTALDVTIQAQILDLLVELRERYRMAVLFITHDLGVVARIADRIAVMYGGQIVETGSTYDIFERAEHPYTRGLLGAVPRIDRQVTRLAGIPGAVPSAAAWPSGCRFHPRCAERLERCEADAPPRVEIATTHAGCCWLMPRGKADA